jgi:predicted enzyme related to lactoylglutathione lyase
MTSRSRSSGSRAAGGHADEPDRRPYGLLAEFVDDQGARFRLWQSVG